VLARPLAAARILKANVVRPSRPLKINLALTYWCQYRCETCNIWRRQPVDELTTGELVEFVQRNPHVSWLDLTGGEIFLRDDIATVVDAIVDTWTELAILHFPTNGFLTDRIAAVAARAGRSRIPQVVVTVSVDGDEPLNDRIRGIKGGFRRQMATFNALRELPGVRPVFGMTLSQRNLGAVERTFAACQHECPGLELRDFHVNIAQLSDHYYGNADDASVVPPREAAVAELKRYRAMRGSGVSVEAWLETRYLNELDRFLSEGVTPMRCHALRSSCFIDPWGVVFPCISYSRPLGSLRESGMRLDTIWNAADVRRTQSEIWDGQCPQCWTACEAYQSILGNALAPWRRSRPDASAALTPAGPRPSENGAGRG